MQWLKSSVHLFSLRSITGSCLTRSESIGFAGCSVSSDMWPSNGLTSSPGHWASRALLRTAFSAQPSTLTPKLCVGTNRALFYFPIALCGASFSEVSS